MSRSVKARVVATSAACLLLTACSADKQDATSDVAGDGVAAPLSMTTQILVTSEAGDKLATQENVAFQAGEPVGTTIVVRPEVVKQTIVGIGSSFTESSAFVLAHLEPAARSEVMDNIFSENGANFSLTRTTIGSTDFSVKGKHSYADEPGDGSLDNFSIAVDEDGFSTSEYPGIRDEAYDVLPMIKEAMAIKGEQEDADLRIVASAWTAPPWMKDLGDWFVRGAPENNFQGTGGKLKPEHEQTYADYLARYLAAYQAEGVDIWGLTPVNEPHGNSGNWESMHFTPETQNEFIKNNLGPTLKASGFEDVNVLIYDQNRDDLEHWADAIFGDPETAQYVHGAAVHWYSSTYKVHEDVFDRVHAKYPNFSIMHTEGTIDDLGKDAPGGIGDPENFKESDWFDNDEFWWNDTATDWAYTPVHRYARNIIVSLNHWMDGWIDWNVVLDSDGGPNHAGNFCGAPIMIDTETGQVYYTPIYHVLKQFSRTIRPGDKAVQADKELVDLDADALHASATVNNDGLLSVQLLNTTKEAIEYSLQIGAQYAPVEIAANSIQTVQVQLAD